VGGGSKKDLVWGQNRLCTCITSKDGGKKNLLHGKRGKSQKKSPLKKQRGHEKIQLPVNCCLFKGKGMMRALRKGGQTWKKKRRLFPEKVSREVGLRGQEGRANLPRQ